MKPPPPVVSNAYGNSSVKFDVRGVGDLVWYTSPTGGTGSLTQPSLDFGATQGVYQFYVASRVANGVESDRATVTLIYDGIAPTGTITAPSALRCASEIDFTVRFSEPVQNVDASDFVLSGMAIGRISAITPIGIGNKDYTVTVSDIRGFGKMQLDLGASANIVDRASNAVTITGSTAYAVQPPPPTTASVTGNSSAKLDARAAPDCTLVYYTAPTGGTGSLTQPSLDFGATQGAHVFYVANRTADGIESDRAALTLTYDGIAPTGTITAPSASPGASKLDFTVHFSEPAYYVDSTDFVLSGSATGRISAVTPVGIGNKDYIVSVSDIRGFGQMQLDLGASANIVDRAGNAVTITSSTAYEVIPPAPTGGGGGPTTPVVSSTGGTASPGTGQIQIVTGITSGALVVDGAGTVELTGINTYTGTTEVKAGTLVVNGSIVSPVSVQSGATLGGSGSTGTVSVAAGGTLSPGNSPGILSTRDLSLAAGAVLKQEIGGTASGQFDQLKVTGTVSLSGASLDVAAFGTFASARGDRFVIIDNDGTDAVTGHFAGLNEGAVVSFGARNLRISYHGGDGNDVSLTDTTGLAFQPERFGTVVNSVESGAGQVYGLYEALLNRAPDPLGLSGFTSALENGASLTQVAGTILGSPEHGPAQTNAAAYVESLYTNLLNRSADAAGLQDWTGALAAGASQASVAAQIATSAEAKAVLAPAFTQGVFVFDTSEASVARLYYGLLDRAPDAGGLRGYAAFIETGGGGPAGEAARLGEVVSSILTSQEYTNQHTGQSDAAFVFELYQDALGRAPDAGGQAGYLSALAHGTSRAQVALDITQSPEAQVHWLGHIQDGTLLVA